MWTTWNPWHGCRKLSPGCANCYMYRIDERYERDPTQIAKTSNYLLPLARRRDGSYKIEPGSNVFTCGSSDFFLAEADEWRIDAWNAIRLRPDLKFLIITKRIDRFETNLPADWGDGYPQVEIACTCENQQMADLRLPIFLKAKIAKKSVVCEPLLERINLLDHLKSGGIRSLIAGGESGPNARPCDFEWVLNLRAQCAESKVSFNFKQTGANFKKDGRTYKIPKLKQGAQARKSGIDLNF